MWGLGGSLGGTQLPDTTRWFTQQRAGIMSIHTLGTRVAEHTACRILNPHRANIRASFADSTDGPAKYRLLSGRTQVDITETAARVWDGRDTGIPRRLPGPCPEEVIIGKVSL